MHVLWIKKVVLAFFRFDRRKMGKELIKIEMERENLQQKWGITVQAQFAKFVSIRKDIVRSVWSLFYVVDVSLYENPGELHV